jgi:hypothetical protein
MEITADLLRTELAAMEQRRAQQVADLNVTEGALQVLRQLIERLEASPREVASVTDLPSLREQRG